MRTRLSEIEQLRLDKKTLTEECKQYEEGLKYKINYTKSNFGHLLLNTVISSAKNGFSELKSPLSGKSSKDKKAKKTSGIGSYLMSAAPLIWQVAQPLLIGLAVKKTKSIFTRKRKKK